VPPFTNQYRWRSTTPGPSTSYHMQFNQSINQSITGVLLTCGLKTDYLSVFKPHVNKTPVIDWLNCMNSEVKLRTLLFHKYSSPKIPSHHWTAFTNGFVLVFQLSLLNMYVRLNWLIVVQCYNSYWSQQYYAMFNNCLLIYLILYFSLPLSLLLSNTRGVQKVLSLTYLDKAWTSEHIFIF